MHSQSLLIDKTNTGIATLTLNRPDKHNAFDDHLIRELLAALRDCTIDPRVRIVILKANGKSFSAGADLNWMRRMAQYSEQENTQDALELAALMQTLNELPKPTIACVQGSVYGGGVGLVACCDIALATMKASFCLSEVKIGLIPAVISPYLIKAIGERTCRRYFLTAESFSAEEAQHLGLIHHVSAAAHFEQAIQNITDQLLQNSPFAITACKELIRHVAQQSQVDDLLIADTARRIAAIRVSTQGQEGLLAFLEKRKPNWLRK